MVKRGRLENSDNEDGLVSMDSSGQSPNQRAKRTASRELLDTGYKNASFVKLKQQLKDDESSKINQFFKSFLKGVKILADAATTGLHVPQGLLDYQWELRRNKMRYMPDEGDVVVMGEDIATGLGPKYDQINGVRPTWNKSLFGMHICGVAAGSACSFFLTQDGKAYSCGDSSDGALARVWVYKSDEDDEQQTLYPKRIINLHPILQERVSKHYIRSPKNEDNDIIMITAGGSHSQFLTLSGNVYFSGFFKDCDSGVFNPGRSVHDPLDDETMNPFNPNETHKDTLESRSFAKKGSLKGKRWNPCHIYKMPGPVVFIASGDRFAAAILGDRSLVTYGMGQSGELARTATMNPPYENGEPMIGRDWYKNEETRAVDYEVIERFMKPQPVLWQGGLRDMTVSHVACGGSHILVVARSPQDEFPRAYSSGCGGHGRLGHGDERARHELTLVKPLENIPIERVAAGGSHSLFLTSKGDAVYACGSNDFGQCGVDPDKQSTAENEKASSLDDSKRGKVVMKPELVAFPKPREGRFADVVCGDSNSFAYTTNGKLYSWGFNDYGQSGRDPNYEGGEKDIKRPRLVHDWFKDSEPVVKAVSSGAQHSLVLAVRCKKP